MKGYLIKHFGTLDKCAEELGVTVVTVRNWIRKNPRGILKHAPEIIATKDTTYLQLQGEVMVRQEEIEKIEPTAHT
jgi:predicted transcriptional regulator|tara:strand:- start:379 stop:606 length:228 start_codon:yes stop_codon:yes gene_type:complete